MRRYPFGAEAQLPDFREVDTGATVSEPKAQLPDFREVDT